MSDVITGVWLDTSTLGSPPLATCNASPKASLLRAADGNSGKAFVRGVRMNSLAPIDDRLLAEPKASAAADVLGFPAAASVLADSPAASSCGTIAGALKAEFAPAACCSSVAESAEASIATSPLVAYRSFACAVLATGPLFALVLERVSASSRRNA